MSGEISLELQLDKNLYGSGASRTGASFESVADIELLVNVAPFAHLWGEFSLDSTDNRFPDRNPNVGEVGLRIQQLLLHLEHGNAFVFGGKFDVNFGIAWDEAYGIYGGDLAEEYEFDERVGAGAGFRFGNARSGVHQITGSVFFADISALSGDLIAGRDRLRLSDGGVSNTGKPSSFALMLHGNGFLLPFEFDYFASFTQQVGGKGDAHDLTGFSFAASGHGPLPHGVEFDWLAELAQLFHAEGGPRDRTYGTVSGQFGYENYWIAPSITHRIETGDGASAFETTLATISIGHDFDFGVSLSTGFEVVWEGSEFRKLFGLKAEYTTDF